MRSVSATRLAALLGTGPWPRPAYASLADALRRLVVDGRLLVGTRLPSERELVEALDLSRTTVVAALTRLRDEGFVTTRRGSGSTVTIPGSHPALDSGGPGLLPRAPGEDVIDLTYAALPASPGVTAAFETALAELPSHLATSGYQPLGLAVTRRAIANWYQRRGLATEPEQVVVTCGAHAALSATIRALLDPGQSVLVESPSYPNAIVGSRRSGLRVTSLPIEPLGWDPGAFADSCVRSGASLAYLIPDFQNPTGQLMTAPQRAAIAAAARRAGTRLVIDETFVELGIDEPAPAPFATHDASAVTVGSASKMFWGGLRIGWARAPLPLVRPILEARHSLDLGTPVLEQLVVAHLLGQPALLEERRAMVRAMRDALVRSLRRHLPEWSIPMPPGGLSVWCALPQARGDVLAELAPEYGVRVAAGRQFSAEAHLGAHVRIPVCVAVDQTDEVARRLAAAWAASISRGSQRRPAPAHRTQLIA